MEITQSKIKIAPMKTLSHVRKNHAMEHATIHVLSKSHPKISFAGYSAVQGFWIHGQAELQDIQKAVEIAYARLNNGEKQLAVHPNCGTNLAVTGLCTAAASMLALAAESDNDSKFERFSALTSAGLLGAFAGRPLGPEVQKRITTDSDVSRLSIISINCSSLRGKPIFFVKTSLD